MLREAAEAGESCQMDSFVPAATVAVPLTRGPIFHFTARSLICRDSGPWKRFRAGSDCLELASLGPTQLETLVKNSDVAFYRCPRKSLADAWSYHDPRYFRPVDSRQL